MEGSAKKAGSGGGTGLMCRLTLLLAAGCTALGFVGLGLKRREERHWLIATGNLLPLTEQQLVDCETVGAACQGAGVIATGNLLPLSEQQTRRLRHGHFGLPRRAHEQRLRFAKEERHVHGLRCRKGLGGGETKDARVSTNIFVRDLDVVAARAKDQRPIEVIAEALHVLHEAEWPLTQLWCRHSARVAIHGWRFSGCGATSQSAGLP